MGQWRPTKHHLMYDMYVCPFMCAHLWLKCFGRNGSKDNTECIHGTQKESAAGYLQQGAAYDTLHSMYSMWWTTEWRHLIAIREYSTCLCVFWRNKRDGGNGCEGRERGFHRTSHRGCVSPVSTHCLLIHQGKHINMHTNRCIYMHMQTHAKEHTHTQTHIPVLLYTVNNLKYNYFRCSANGKGIVQNHVQH